MISDKFVMSCGKMTQNARPIVGAFDEDRRHLSVPISVPNDRGCMRSSYNCQATACNELISTTRLAETKGQTVQQRSDLQVHQGTGHVLIKHYISSDLRGNSGN